MNIYRKEFLKGLLALSALLMSSILNANTYNLRAVDSELNFTMHGKGYIKSGDVSHDINATIKSNIVKTTSKGTTIQISMSTSSSADDVDFDDISTMILDNYGRIIVDADGCVLSSDPSPLPTKANIGYKSDVYIYTCKDGSTNSNISFLKEGGNGYAKLINEEYEKGKLLSTTTTIINNDGEFDGFLMEGYLEDNGIEPFIKIDFIRQQNSLSLAVNKSCDNGDMMSCYILGVNYQLGNDVKRDYNKAVKLYTKACDGGYANACSNVGMMYGKGQGVTQSSPIAKEFFSKACDGGDGVGCGMIGLMYYQGEEVKQSNQKAKEFFEKACENDSAIGCNNLGVMYDYGTGVIEDNKKAKELYRKACDGGYDLGYRNLKNK